MTRVDKRQMDEQKVEVGVKERYKQKPMRRRLKWAGHVERMGAENLAERKCPVEGKKEARKTENVNGGQR